MPTIASPQTGDSPHTVVSGIKEIISGGNEPSLIRYLHVEVVQAFVDVVHEVCLSIHSHLKRGLIAFPFLLSTLHVEPIRLWIFLAFPHGSGRSA